MTKQIKFDWKAAHGSRERIEWLKANKDNPITEDQYIEHIKALPHNHPKAARCRSTSKNKGDYKYLKTRFGFFGGVS